jgi:hypothetical protein
MTVFSFFHPRNKKFIKGKILGLWWCLKIVKVLKNEMFNRKDLSK